MRDTSYKVQIFLENEDDDAGTIISSTCECPMGQFRCHHVAAALLFGYKRAKPECEEMPALLIEDQLTSEEYMNAQCKSSYLRDKLVISSENVIKTAWMTTGQRENSLWAAVRKLRITASNFGQVIGAIRRNRLTLSLKKRLLSAYNLEKRPSIQWGLTHEKVAIDSYCKLSEVSVLQTGIWLHESGVLGASPDGFVQAREMSIKDACANLKDFFLECDSEGTLRLKESHDYWHQVQGQLYLTGTSCCDFVVWTPVSMEVIRILKDDSWQCHLKNMIEFYFNVFLPSLN
uniref:SWIM-type domain-containing protein n=1 Tax=Magallana gigas TaxID=29159 RepID=A0A8W8NQ72_MAGGI